MQDTRDRERRLRIFYVEQQTMLDIVTNKISIVKNGLEDNLEVVAVDFCFLRQSFRFLVRHDSFDIVPTNIEPPVHMGSFNLKYNIEQETKT